MAPIAPSPPPNTPVKLEPTAHTWVMRDQEGKMVAIRVTDMTDSHLMRWVQYFRRKYRERYGAAAQLLTDQEIDLKLKASMVTAPAIFAEAATRGVVIAATPPVAPVPTVADAWRDAAFTNAGLNGPAARMAPRPAPKPGQRKITLDEE